MKAILDKLHRLVPGPGPSRRKGKKGPRQPVPKPLPALPPFYLLSHLEEDGPVRLDGVKLGICEVMGLELDEPKMGSFAGALNSLDFPVQLLVRQHPPVLARLGDDLGKAQPRGLPPKTSVAAESLRGLLTDLEQREGVLDRRFYAVCRHDRADELASLLSRSGLAVQRLKGRTLRMLILASALGGSPREMDENAEVKVEVNRREMRTGAMLMRSLHLVKWPRSLAPGFLQALMMTGMPMDISLHMGAIPADQASRTLEWQKVRFESARSLSFRKGKTMSPEAEIALEDISRLRDEVQRGQGAAVPLVPRHHPSCQGTRRPSTSTPRGPGPTSPPPWAGWTASPSGRGRGSSPRCPWN